MAIKATFNLFEQDARDVIAHLVQFEPKIAPMLEYPGIRLVVGKYYQRRSNQQNARYWAIVTALAEYSGDTKGGMHDELLCDVFGFDEVEWLGRVKRVPASRSSKLTTPDFARLMETAERWANEHDVKWEQPEEDPTTPHTEDTQETP